MRCRKRNANGPMFTIPDRRKEECDDERLLTSVVLRLVQVCPAVVPQFFTN